jgi:hypothetical protein
LAVFAADSCFFPISTHYQSTTTTNSMKNLFSVAILAAAFTFASCGNKPADAANTAAATTTSASTTATPAPAPAPAVDNSLSGRAVSVLCNCPVMKEIADLNKVKETDPEKSQANMAKAMQLMEKVKDCPGVSAIDEEVKKLSADDMKKHQAEMQEKVAKTCPDLMPNK